MENVDEFRIGTSLSFRANLFQGFLKKPFFYRRDKFSLSTPDHSLLPEKSIQQKFTNITTIESKQDETSPEQI